MLAIDGDKSAYCDEAIKKKIAGFPPEIKDHELLTKIKGDLLQKIFSAIFSVVIAKLI